MAEADIGGGRDGCQVVLIAYETAGQGVGAAITFCGAAFTEVSGRGAVQAGTGDQPVFTAEYQVSSLKAP